MSDEQSKRPRRSRSALWREHDGRAVLFHEDTGRAFVLNETGTRIWKTLDGDRSIEDLLGSVSEPQRADAVQSALRFCATIEEAGLIDFADAAGARASEETAAFVQLGSWEPPEAEEIMFGACDCVTGIGLVRNTVCEQLMIPQQTTSTT